MNFYIELTKPLLFSSGFRTPATAGAHPSGRRLLGQNSEGIPAHETHAGPQSDHGGSAEIPAVSH